MDQLRRVIKDVLRKRHADLYEILNNPEALKQFSISLYSVEGITKATKNNPEFNALIRDYESGMLFFKTVKQFSQHCLSFITSLQSVGGPAIDAANELKKAWTDEVNRELPDLSASQFLILKSGSHISKHIGSDYPLEDNVLTTSTAEEALPHQSSLTDLSTTAHNVTEGSETDSISDEPRPSFFSHFQHKLRKDREEFESIIRNQQPDSPTQVRECCTKKSSNMLKLRWNPPVFSAVQHHSYEVYMMNKEGVMFICIGKAHKCSFTVNNLSQNTEYNFRICSVNEDGLKSSFTRIITVQTMMHVPFWSLTYGFAVLAALAFIMDYITTPDRLWSSIGAIIFYGLGFVNVVGKVGTTHYCIETSYVSAAIGVAILISVISIFARFDVGTGIVFGAVFGIAACASLVVRSGEAIFDYEMIGIMYGLGVAIASNAIFTGFAAGSGFVFATEFRILMSSTCNAIAYLAAICFGIGVGNVISYIVGMFYDAIAGIVNSIGLTHLTLVIMIAMCMYCVFAKRKALFKLFWGKTY